MCLLSRLFILSLSPPPLSTSSSRHPRANRWTLSTWTTQTDNGWRISHQNQSLCLTDWRLLMVIITKLFGVSLIVRSLPIFSGLFWGMLSYSHDTVIAHLLLFFSNAVHCCADTQLSRSTIRSLQQPLSRSHLELLHQRKEYAV